MEKCVAEGTFNLDGGWWEVENNVWCVGAAAECAVVDPPAARCRARGGGEAAP
ncbi:hypothetical protein QJS66_00530 [Kocuria rhizophila]|nr:hypothetical protein QJS66_00530 [Kocuria rhizophila]